MTTDDHNPTSQPWPPSQPVDTAGDGESEKTPTADTTTGSPAEADGEATSADNANPGAAAAEPTPAPELAPAAETANQAPEGGAPWPADPAAGPWGAPDGFAPPTADGGPGNGAAPMNFAPPAPGSGQFPQPDPNQFPSGGPGYASGQFPQPAPGPYPPPYPGPDSGQFAPPDPNQFPPSNAGYAGGQFAPPGVNQFQAPPSAPGAGPFDQPNPYQAPGPEPSSGGFQAPEPGGPHSSGQFEQPGFRAPDSAPPHGSGQFPTADVNGFTGQPHPGQPPYPGADAGAPGPDAGPHFDPSAGGFAPGGSPDPTAPAPQAETQGDPGFGWAPPPMPTAPPQQPTFPQAPPGPNNPQSGQFEAPGRGADPSPQTGGQQPFPQQPNQPPGQFQPRHMPEPGQPGHSVNDLNLLKRARKAPRGGWRRAVHKVSRGVINPGESAADIVHRDLVSRVNAPVHGDFRIAILSLKGGVGKTTTTVGLGSTFASLRGDRVIAIDANPDLGTLAHRVPRQTRSTVRNLLEDQNITRYSDVRAHTSQAPSRLEVLASEQDPAVSEAFSEADYRRAIGILQSFYNIILTDCGTGLMHSAMSGVLDMASSLVLVTSPAIDGARSASATLDWLEYHGYAHLVRQTVVVVNASRRGSTSVNLDHLRRLFLDRTRAVQVVPFDDHLAEGAEIDLELVSKPTRMALLELAAMVADDFANVDGYPYGNRY